MPGHSAANQTAPTTTELLDAYRGLVRSVRAANAHTPDSKLMRHLEDVAEMDRRYQRVPTIVAMRGGTWGMARLQEHGLADANGNLTLSAGEVLLNEVAISAVERSERAADVAEIAQGRSAEERWRDGTYRLATQALDVAKKNVVDACERAARAGVEERLVHLNEEMGKQMAYMIRGALGDAGLWDAHRDVLLPLLRKWMLMAQRGPLPSPDAIDTDARPEPRHESAHVLPPSSEELFGRVT